MYKKNKDEPPKFAPSMPQTFLVLRCYSCGVFQAQTRLGDLTPPRSSPLSPISARVSTLRFYTRLIRAQLL